MTRTRRSICALGGAIWRPRNSRSGRRKAVAAAATPAARSGKSVRRFRSPPVERARGLRRSPCRQAPTEIACVSVAASDCGFHVFVGPKTRFSDCDRAKDFLTKAGLSFESRPAEAGPAVVTRISSLKLDTWDEAAYKEALTRTEFPAEVDRSRIDRVSAATSTPGSGIRSRWRWSPSSSARSACFPALSPGSAELQLGPFGFFVVSGCATLSSNRRGEERRQRAW